MQNRVMFQLWGLRRARSTAVIQLYVYHYVVLCIQVSPHYTMSAHCLHCTFQKHQSPKIRLCFRDIFEVRYIVQMHTHIQHICAIQHTNVLTQVQSNWQNNVYIKHLPKSDSPYVLPIYSTNTPPKIGMSRFDKWTLYWYSLYCSKSCCIFIAIISVVV